MAWRQIGKQAIIWTNADQIHWCIYAALDNDDRGNIPDDTFDCLWIYVCVVL